MGINIRKLFVRRCVVEIDNIRSLSDIQKTVLTTEIIANDKVHIDEQSIAEWWFRSRFQSKRFPAGIGIDATIILKFVDPVDIDLRIGGSAPVMDHADADIPGEVYVSLEANRK